MRKKTGLDWPELRVGGIEKAMTSTTVCLLVHGEGRREGGHEKQLELTDEEAESIGA